MSKAKQLVEFVEASMPLIQACWRSYYKRGWNARIDNGPRHIHARSSHQSFWIEGWDDADKKLKAGIKIRRKKDNFEAIHKAREAAAKEQP